MLTDSASFSIPPFPFTDYAMSTPHYQWSHGPRIRKTLLCVSRISKFCGISSCRYENEDLKVMERRRRLRTPDPLPSYCFFFILFFFNLLIFLRPEELCVCVCVSVSVCLCVCLCQCACMHMCVWLQPVSYLAFGV